VNTSNKRDLVFVVDDEGDIGLLVNRVLEEHGYDVEYFGDGKSVLRRIKTRRPALCLVDLGLPDIEGLDLIKEIRSTYDVAIVVLTVRSQPTDRIIGLELGADDYVVKPFEPLELVARVKSVLRRFHRGNGDLSSTGGGAVARFAGWSFNPQTFALQPPSGHGIELSASEARLLTVMLRSPNQILSREYLLDERDGRNLSPFDRSIDIAVSRLRQKIETDPRNPQVIKTVYGAGYIFAADVEWDG